MDRYDYQALVNEVVTRGINLFESFDDWTKGAFALSNLGEDGRSMFKSISKLSSKYSETENHRKFTNALHTNNKVGIASFIYMCRQHGIDTNKFYIKDDVEWTQPVATVVNHHPRTVMPVAICKEYVTRSLDRNLRSDLVSYLKTVVADVDRLFAVVKAYHLGITRGGHVIFWYVDKDGVVRMGKVMSYAANGHRDKSVTPLSILRELSRCGKLQADYVIKKTLFGEHLLRYTAYAENVIGIVESEKSAVVCSLCFPNVLWMATGSKGNLQDERMSAVKERKVILFPDTDVDGQAYTQWHKRADELNAKGWNIQVCNYLEQVVTSEKKKKKIDIADLLIDDLFKGCKMHIAAVTDMLQKDSFYRREQVYVLSDSKPLLPANGELSASRWSHLHK